MADVWAQAAARQGTSSLEDYRQAVKELVVWLVIQHGLDAPDLYDLCDEAIETVRR